ncbi:hypothetical protein [Nocardia asiatica]|uniref:hypothetical protein n=1 Tax=Nocardia asiatica TaxID=209252 RepID=UPI003EDEDD1C
MSTNPDDRQALAPVGLDLVAPELYAPMLRRLALAASGIGLGAALLAATVVSWPIAAAIGVVVGAPTVLYAVALRRRRMWVTGTTIHARRLFGERQVEMSAVTGVEILVFPARLSRIALRVTAGRSRRSFRWPCTPTRAAVANCTCSACAGSPTPCRRANWRRP